MEKEWMNAPLPPLSQSIVASGLVVGEYTIANAPHPTNKKPRSSSTINISSVKRSSPKIVSQRPPKINPPSDLDILSDKTVLSTSTAKSSRPPNIHSLSPTPKKALKRKLQPVEQFHIYTQEERDQIYKHEKHHKSKSSDEKIDCIQSLLDNKKSHALGNLSSSRIKSERAGAMETSKKIFREETNEIITELDANIASLGSNFEGLETLPVDQQAEIKVKLLQFHNFSFNKLILQERATCTERAILMRRFHKFYNQLVGDIPLILENIHNFTADYNKKYESLLEQSKAVELNMTNGLADNNILKGEIENLKQQIQSLTENNNQKDIQISSFTFDLDLAKCQNTQFQIKIKSKKDKIKNLKQHIEKLEDENKIQINQIEKMRNTISELNQSEFDNRTINETQIVKIKELEGKIINLEKVNFTLTHIEKADIETQTDTETINPPVTKSLLPKPIKRNRRGSTTTIPHFKPPSSLSQDVSNGKDEKNNLTENDSNINKPKSSKKQNFSKTQPISDHISIDDQISFENIIESKKEEIIKDDQKPIEKFLIEKNDVEVQTVFQEEEKKGEKSDTQKVEKKGENNSPSESDKYSQFKVPNHYSVNHSKIDQLPDLFDIIMPFLSHPYVTTADQELKVIKSFYTSRKSDKPVIWAIQLIHSFLTDSFVRASKNIEQSSIESIFVNWMSNHYNLPHLVQQAIGDFTTILLTNRYYMPLLSFFTEILTGQFSFAQLCFLSTIYTFSCEFTFPSISSLLQSLNFEEEKQPLIHIECIEKLVKNCFSSEIAARFIKKEFNNNLVNKDPMIPYLVFLRKATELFGEEHQTLYSKSKDLILLCGCYDNCSINFECFVKFFSLLGFGVTPLKKSNSGCDGYSEIFESARFDFKEEWKKALKKFELNEGEKEVKLLNVSAILSVCAERKSPLIRLLELDSLKVSLNRVKNLSSFISDLYYDLMMRYSTLMPRVFAKMPQGMLRKIEECYERLRKSLLKADVGAIVYSYRLMLNKIDRLAMKEKGFIPFNVNSNSEVIKKLVEYVDRTESVSFVLID